jgi:hypothetical protein
MVLREKNLYRANWSSHRMKRSRFSFSFSIRFRYLRLCQLLNSIADFMLITDKALHVIALANFIIKPQSFSSLEIGGKAAYGVGCVE